MRNRCRLAVALAGAIAILAPQVEAATLSVDEPAQVAPGWTRISGRYEGADRAPEFRAIARCRGSEADARVLPGIVHLAPTAGAVWLDLPGTPDRLAPDSVPCAAPLLSVEMLVDATVVATAPIARRESAAGRLLVPSPAPPARRARNFSFKGQKYNAPFGKRTEAGVEWALDSRVSIQLNYERTSQAPMMPFDHDDGILTRLRFGF